MVSPAAIVRKLTKLKRWAKFCLLAGICQHADNALGTPCVSRVSGGLCGVAQMKITYKVRLGDCERAAPEPPVLVRRSAESLNGALEQLE